MSTMEQVSASLADKPDLLTQRQAASLLQVSVRTIGRWRTEGRLESVRTGHGRQSRVLIPKAAILEFLTTFNGSATHDSMKRPARIGRRPQQGPPPGGHLAVMDESHEEGELSLDDPWMLEDVTWQETSQ